MAKEAALRKVCKPFGWEKYQNIDLNRLAAYAIHMLARKSVLVTFENVVVALFIMFPRKFCLPVYEHYPDSSRVNRALLQLRPKYRNWATGSPVRGFKLTSTGIAIAEDTAKALTNPAPLSKEPPRMIKPRTFSPQLEIENRVLNREIFSKYDKNQVDQIDGMEVLELLRAVPHTPPNILRGHLRELENIAKEAHSTTALEFLRFLRHRFSSLFEES